MGAQRILPTMDVNGCQSPFGEVTTAAGACLSLSSRVQWDLFSKRETQLKYAIREKELCVEWAVQHFSMYSFATIDVRRWKKRSSLGEKIPSIAPIALFLGSRVFTALVCTPIAQVFDRFRTSPQLATPKGDGRSVLPRLATPKT